MIKQFIGGNWVPQNLGKKGVTGVTGSGGSTGPTGNTGPRGYPSDHASMLTNFTNAKALSFFDFQNDNISTLSLVNATIYLAMMYVPDLTTITGLYLPKQANSNLMTYNNNNKVGLYTSNGTTLTRIAQSANDGTIWNSPAMRSVPFTSTVNVQGIVYGAFLLNYSATGGNPSMPVLNIATATAHATGNTSSGGVSGMFRSGTIGSQTDLGTTIATSGVTSAAKMPLIGLY